MADVNNGGCCCHLGFDADIIKAWPLMALLPSWSSSSLKSTPVAFSDIWLHTYSCGDARVYGDKFPYFGGAWTARARLFLSITP